jgi:hypothetical protein
MVSRRSVWSLFLALSLGLSLAACGGGEKKDADVPGNDPKPDSTGGAPKDPPPPPPEKKTGVDALSADQKKQLEIALKRGGEGSAHCPDVVEGTKSGEGDVKVTYDGSSGRVSEVVVPPPWAGTPAESCIKKAFSKEVVMPFEGKLEVPYTIKLTSKAPPPKKK